MHVDSLSETASSRIRPVLIALFAAVLFVLLVTCVNVANLMLARTVGRSKELAVRIVLGAGQLRLAQQMLAESLVFAFLGGVTGLLEPRAAFSYLFKKTKTVLRGGFLHNLETPVNANLVASSSTGPGGLASGLLGESAQERAIQLGSRNQT